MWRNYSKKQFVCPGRISGETSGNPTERNSTGNPYKSSRRNLWMISWKNSERNPSRRFEADKKPEPETGKVRHELAINML